MHLIERYGFDEVTSWYFETYNEPNIKDLFWNHSLHTGLSIYPYTGVNKEKDIMIRWDDANDYTIKTYEIWYSYDNKKIRKSKSNGFYRQWIPFYFKSQQGRSLPENKSY